MRQMHLGELLRDEGCEKVAEHNPRWMDEAKAMIRHLAAVEPQFTSDALRDRLRAPPHQNCVGAAFRAVAREGQIERIGYVKADSASRHAAVIGLWRKKQ